jgi:hypothetical protein
MAEISKTTVASEPDISPDKPKRLGKRARAKELIARADGPISHLSPNPKTNLMLTDLALRGGGQLVRHLIERALLGTQYSPKQAKAIVKGRSMTQTLLGTAAARIAMRSVPGAIIVGGGLLAKTLYDRKKGAKAKIEGEKAVNQQAAKVEPRRKA